MKPGVEPTFDGASQWWPEMPNKWAPVGWKNHLLRFNVLWSGAILAKPNLNRRTSQYDGQGAQFTFAPAMKPVWDASTTAFTRVDDGMTRQGWTDDAAPVLWTEFAADGLLLREEVFGWIPGAGDVQGGDEPLYAWVRLRVAYCCPSLPLEDRHGVVVKINCPHLATRMSMRDHIFLNESLYPRPLQPEAKDYSPDSGWRLLEPDGKVRVAVAAGAAGGKLTFIPPHPDKSDSTMDDAFVHLSIPAQEGSHVDLLIPMLPTDREAFDRELQVGYDKALAQANDYWQRQRPRSAATIHTPEEAVDEAIRQNARLAVLLAEKNPADRQYSVLIGSLAYGDLWATPGSMAVVALDEMGYHADAARYLQVFRKEQGTVVAPGGSFTLHPGYLSTPKTLTSIDWLSDHGALLWAISNHALLSGDEQFTRDWLPVIEKACDFIQYARRLKGHGGYEGIMPPAVATDRQTRIQAIWNDGWMYKGLTTAVRVFRQAKHPRAEEFAKEADDYKAAFLATLRDKCGKMPTWTDSAGRTYPLLPTSLFNEDKAETRGAFYLDTGPLFLVFAGLVSAEDPMMRSTLEWFRAGPQMRMYRPDSNCWQVPCLWHEMSSCEPCYSWNIYHSYQLGDRQGFLTGLYSLLAGGMSRQTFVSSETRGGQSGLWASFTLAMDLLRRAMVDDQLVEGELHLLRLAPRAWLCERETVFNNLPTEFGPVDLSARLVDGGAELDVRFNPRFRTPPRGIVLHIPPVQGLARIVVNGRPVEWDTAAPIIELRPAAWSPS